MNQQEQTSTDP